MSANCAWVSAKWSWRACKTSHCFKVTPLFADHDLCLLNSWVLGIIDASYSVLNSPIIHYLLADFRYGQLLTITGFSLSCYYSLPNNPVQCPEQHSFNSSHIHTRSLLGPLLVLSLQTRPIASHGLWPIGHHRPRSGHLPMRGTRQINLAISMSITWYPTYLPTPGRNPENKTR